MKYRKVYLYLLTRLTPSSTYGREPQLDFMHLSDIDLIRAIRTGDYHAFRELYSRYSDLIYRNIMVRVNSSFDADDIFQDFFVRLWERRDTLQIDGNVRGYLLVWLRNHIFNTIKEKQIRQRHHSSPELKPPEGDEYEWVRIESRDLIEKLRGVVDRFPPSLRAVYVLRREENMSVREIAQRLGVSEQTVKNQVADINKRLKKAVGNKSFLLVI